LEISFDNKEIRALCEFDEKAKAHYGNEIALHLRIRLADLRAASNIYDVLIGHPEELDHGANFSYKVDLCDGYLLIFSANHISKPLLENGNLDWSQVRRIKILKIANINGEDK
jgi:hypothetical protein